MAAEAMAAIGFRSSQVALGAMRNLGLDRLSTSSVPSASSSAARPCSRLPEMFEGGETVFNTGNAARRVSHNIVALARCTGSGRGASRRSGQPGSLDCAGVTRRGIFRKRRADSDQEL